MNISLYWYFNSPIVNSRSSLVSCQWATPLASPTVLGNVVALLQSSSPVLECHEASLVSSEAGWKLLCSMHTAFSVAVIWRLEVRVDCVWHVCPLVVAEKFNPSRGDRRGNACEISHGGKLIPSYSSGLSVHLSTCLSVHPYICLYTCLSVCLSIYLEGLLRNFTTQKFAQTPPQAVWSIYKLFKLFMLVAKYDCLDRK